ncbi:aldo/keto reductase [Penicillium argentinense]|uniref:Aldo/keto reductase n=1 Tax=Penicillium argentinense TaxID=1131581 RepID=A0A9W9JUI6_9EURO|nr:aldo/keto reductase [Penicillium argentinense]KAJ5081990.1 aldo/keto reductase [Penicillium argentinense]
MIEIVGRHVGPRGYGLMNFTWRKDPIAHKQAFEALRAAIDGNMTFWNGGDFYGTPEDADKVDLSIKGVFRPNMQPDGSPQYIRHSLDSILAQLKGWKKHDIFECARRDPKVPLETKFGVIEKEYVQTGKVGGVCLSETSAASIHEAVKITKIVGVEVELSLFSTDVLTNGVAEACVMYGIPLIAYSPLGRGLLAGQVKTIDDTPESDSRRNLPRFQTGNFDINLQLVKQVEEMATKRSCTPAQLALGWVTSLQRRPGMPTIIPIPGGTSAAKVCENAKQIDLTDEEMNVFDATLDKFEVAGGRYPDGVPVDT